MITQIIRSIPELSEDARIIDPYKALDAIKALIIDEEINLQLNQTLGLDCDQVWRRLVELNIVLSDLRCKLRS
jgi:hypothetical protein